MMAMMSNSSRVFSCSVPGTEFTVSCGLAFIMISARVLSTSFSRCWALGHDWIQNKRVLMSFGKLAETIGK